MAVSDAAAAAAAAGGEAGGGGGGGPGPAGGPEYLEALLEEIESVSRDPGSAQRQALRGILEKHGRCEYLEKLQGLEGRTDAGSFRAAVPLSSHADYADYIERIKEGPRQRPAAGEHHLVCCSPLVALSRSSGTTGGVSKYFLVSQDLHHHSVRTQYIQQALMRRSFPSKLPPGVGKSWYTYQSGARADTGSGLKASTITTVTIHSPEYARFYAAAGAVSPLPVVRCADMHQGMYAHLLCALSAADAVEGIYGSFAFSLVEQFRTLRRVWPSLCRDVREGRVCADAVTDEELRRVLLTEVVVAPNPAAADRIQTHCSSGDWDGILLRLFPNLQFIVAACSGSMAPYAAALDALTRPGFPRLGFGYGSSEAGHCAFYLPPDEAGTPAAGPDTFVLWPRSLYYEFIPVATAVNGAADDADADAVTATGTTTTTTTVELAELQLGRDYELVVTTPAGLYRYQQTDVVRVAAFYRALPVLEFVARKGVLLSINTDKTDEAELQAVVAAAAAGAAPAPGVAVANFSSHADHSTAPGHYVIYWELEEQQKEKKDAQAHRDHQQQERQQQQLQGCCDAMDAALNEPYRRGRRHGFIGPLELRVLAPGTFNRVRDVAAGLGGSLTQFKVPRCVGNPAFLAVLDAGTVRAFHSTHLHVE